LKSSLGEAQGVFFGKSLFLDMAMMYFGTLELFA
jgi:hypothetical protein